MANEHTTRIFKHSTMMSKIEQREMTNILFEAF